MRSLFASSKFFEKYGKRIVSVKPDASENERQFEVEGEWQFDVTRMLNGLSLKQDENLIAILENAFFQSDLHFKHRINHQFLKMDNSVFGFFGGTKEESSDLLYSHLALGNIHSFVDGNTELFFEPIQKGQMAATKLQKGLLLKAWLNLQMGNLEEAQIGLSDTIRFAQTHQDDAIVNFSLMYLSVIAKIRQDFLTEAEVFRSFFRSKLESKNPIMAFFICLAKIDLNSKTSLAQNQYDKNDHARNEEEEINYIEALNYSLKKILCKAEESFFNRQEKFRSLIDPFGKYLTLTHVKFMENSEDILENYKPFIRSLDFFQKPASSSHDRFLYLKQLAQVF